MYKEWFKAAWVRALRTVAQTAVAMIGTALVLHDVDWVATLSAAILAGVLSILTSLGGLPEVDAEIALESVLEELEGEEEPEEESDG